MNKFLVLLFALLVLAFAQEDSFDQTSTSSDSSDDSTSGETSEQEEECPSDKPYERIDNNECTACTGTNEHKVEEGKRCVVCEAGQTWDSTTNECKTPTTTCPTDCECAEGSNECTGCKADSNKYFKEDTKTCIACTGTNEHKVEDGKKCVVCTTEQTWNETTNKCEDKPKECPADCECAKGSDVCTGCKEEGKYLNESDNKCIACDQTNEHQVEKDGKKTCVVCKADQTWNSTTNTCVDPEPKVCPEGCTCAENSDVCTGCKEEGKYLNESDNKCIACNQTNEHQVEKDGKKTCVVCKADQEWNKDKNVCEDKDDESSSNAQTVISTFVLVIAVIFMMF